jgi:general secretion pathway protein G
MKSKKQGFTLVEIMIVIVIIAVLAAAIIPQFTDSTNDARESTARFNLQTLRGQLEVYKTQHLGQYPPTLGDLAKTTNADHTTTGTPTYGPYCFEIPSDAITDVSTVTASTADPIGGTITGTAGGWIYNATTGELRINHKDYDDK